MLKKNDSPATRLLISMLIRYPELASVRYEPPTQSLIFSFFLRGESDLFKQNECIADMQAYFQVWMELDRAFSPLGKLLFTPLENITLVTYQQSITQISTAEIVLLTHVLQTHFVGQVAWEPIDIDEEDLQLQEALINRLLGHRESLKEGQQVVAYREDGKVYVYNR